LTPTVIKVGVTVKDDLLYIAGAWGLSELRGLMRVTSNPCFIELGQFAKLKGAIASAGVSLPTLSAIVLRHRMSHENLLISDWSSPMLTDDQGIYAAREAYANLHIWLGLSAKPSVGVLIDNAVPGQLVSIMSGKKIAAYGVLAAQPLKLTVPVSNTSKELKISAKTAVVTVEKVVLEGMIIKAQKLSLQQLGPPPFVAIVPLSSLRTRSLEEAHHVPSGVPSFLQPAIPQLPEYLPPPPAEEVLGQNRVESTLDIDDNNETIPEEQDDDDDLYYDGIVEPGENSAQIVNAQPQEDDSMQIDSEGNVITSEAEHSAQSPSFGHQTGLYSTRAQ
jgi:hypothetical protein